ncbi:hypothetical protein GOP47_0026453 [Adiantum capillus-veneris]|nr:hypothetical protein GOP47_0026453 [Adiantum capillus-veneris]
MDSDASSAAPPSDGAVLLAGEDDRFGGFIIDPLGLPAHPPDFLAVLRTSLAHWKDQSKRGIWLKLPIDKSNLVPLAVEEGFIYHHAEKDYLMLTYWIPEEESTLPANASHQVGIGAIVINDQNEILVVQEKSGPMHGLGIWKMPTGVVLQGEDILEAAIREVKEETGVDTEFVEVFGFRQGHDVAFGKSDLFFLCKLLPLSTEIVVQENEIEAAQWIPFEDYKAQEFNTSSMLLSRFADIATASCEGKYKGFGAETLKLGFRNKGSLFYHNIQDIQSYHSHVSSKI